MDSTPPDGGPAGPPRSGRRRPSLRRSLTGLRRSFVLWGLSLRALHLSLWLWTLYLLLPVGVLSGPLPAAQRGVRRLVDRQRALAAAWSGVDIPARYPELPEKRQGAALRGLLAARDNQVWRDWRLVVVDPLAGGALALVPVAMAGSALWGLTAAFLGDLLPDSWGSLWYLFVPVTGPVTAACAAVLAVAVAAGGLLVAPGIPARHARYLKRMLAPGAEERLAERIDHLTATRTDAVDTQLAEIRRIERDLHDGAQVRLVAMGMTLNAAERLLKSDPEAVPALLAEARQSSSKALEELRDLVRGIHPPILADRGLGDAVRSLAMLCPLPTDVEVDLPGRPEPPVEAAAYFAVSEILANAAKHSGAERARIDVRHTDGMLRIAVSDDGRGGADPAGGSGLRGVERRLATFDGVLAVSSPLDGPTLIALELPCVLSSPKTTSC